MGNLYMKKVSLPASHGSRGWREYLKQKKSTVLRSIVTGYCDLNYVRHQKLAAHTAAQWKIAFRDHQNELL
jgi:hypothetical protein